MLRGGFRQCWLAVEGVAEPVRLKTGDCFLLPRGLAVPPGQRPDRAADRALLNSGDCAPDGGVASFNGGGDCFGVGGYFALRRRPCRHPVGMLPPIVHIRNESDKATMRWRWSG